MAIEREKPIETDFVVDAKMAGYLLAPNERVQEEIDAVLAIYAAA